MIAAIIQARMGSSRLPGKVLADICGKPMLWHIINRLSYSDSIEKIIIATTALPEDRQIIDIAEQCSVSCYAGSELDVLDRYYQAAKQYDADPIIRITADCPVIDPFLVDEVLFEYQKSGYDMYCLDSSFPDGLDTEVFSMDALQEAYYHARLLSEREHVTPYITKNPDRFRIGRYKKYSDLSDIRWTVDEERDLKLIRIIYSRLYHENEIFTTQNILSLIERNPELRTLNSMIQRNEGYEKSVAQDVYNRNLL